MTIVTYRTSGSASLEVLAHDLVDMRRVEQRIGSERRLDPLWTGKQIVHLVDERDAGGVVECTHDPHGDIEPRPPVLPEKTRHRAAVKTALQRELRVRQISLTHAQLRPCP